MRRESENWPFYERISANLCKSAAATIIDLGFIHRRSMICCECIKDSFFRTVQSFFSKEDKHSST